MKTSILIKWTIDDVMEIRPDLNDDQCIDILEYAEKNHDANLGINWESLREIANKLFPKL
jgi:hypothetical protein